MNSVCSHQDAPSDNPSILCFDPHTLVQVLYLEGTEGSLNSGFISQVLEENFD